METHVKIVVTVKAIMLISAIILTLSSIYHSKLYSMQFRVRGVSYLMAGSKTVYEQLRRLLMSCWVVIDLVVLSWQVNRALSGFPPYSGVYAEWSSIVMAFILLVIAILYWIFYNPKAQNYIEKKFPNKIKSNEPPLS